jgi:hypothetical protein
MDIELEEVRDSWEPEGTTNMERMPDGKIVGVHRFIFTHGLMVGLTKAGYDYRFCYGSLVEAQGALRDWKEKGFVGEPTGYIKRK